MLWVSMRVCWARGYFGQVTTSRVLFESEGVVQEGDAALAFRSRLGWRLKRQRSVTMLLRRPAK